MVLALIYLGFAKIQRKVLFKTTAFCCLRSLHPPPLSAEAKPKHTWEMNVFNRNTQASCSPMPLSRALLLSLQMAVGLCPRPEWGRWEGARVQVFLLEWEGKGLLFIMDS